jgi:hypothetical protein
MLARILALAVIVTLFVYQARAADYPETPEGLKKLIEDTVAAVKASDKEKTSKLVKSMLLPNHEAWFKKTFGEELGAKHAEEYTKQTGNFEADITSLFADQVKQNRTVIAVVKVESADDKNATGLQRAAITAMKEKTPLYTVRMTEEPDTAGFTLWSFVYNDGAFRLAGKMRQR